MNFIEFGSDYQRDREFDAHECVRMCFHIEVLK